MFLINDALPGAFSGVPSAAGAVVSAVVLSFLASESVTRLCVAPCWSPPALTRVCPGNQVLDSPQCLPFGAWQPKLKGWEAAYRYETLSGLNRPGVTLVPPHKGDCHPACRHRGERCEEPYGREGFVGGPVETGPRPGD